MGARRRCACGCPRRRARGGRDRSGREALSILRLRGVRAVTASWLHTGHFSKNRAFFEELIAQDPDITLFELRDALADAQGVLVHHSSIANLLSRLGFTYKKRRWSQPSDDAPR